MTDNKQYPPLPEPTAWRTYDNLLKRARYNAMPITSMQPGIYSHTRMFTEDQMRSYVDADRADTGTSILLLTVQSTRTEQNRSRNDRY